MRNVPRPARMEPPIQVVYFRSGGANILILVPFTASRCNSFLTRSPKPIVREMWGVYLLTGLSLLRELLCRIGSVASRDLCGLLNQTTSRGLLGILSR